jgi:TerC family integral membrane protein
MRTPAWAWAATIGLISALVAVDLVVGRRKGTQTPKQAAILSAGWVALSVAFGGVVAALAGRGAAEQFFTGYLLEKLLSVDNIFVFAVLLAAFAVPADAQRRVLSYGVFGALVMRGALIAAGSTLFSSVTWMFYVFGFILVVAGVRMLVAENTRDPDKGLSVRLARRILPVSDGFEGDRFTSRSASGSRLVTPLFVALVAIEATDLVFALDSIPAVFGVTRDAFIVFSSNAFAVLGLRAMYFVFAGYMRRFAYLTRGLAVVLSLIGIKMLLSETFEIPTLVSLGVIGAVVGMSMVLSPSVAGESPDSRVLQR